ncbi:Peroxiredoxin HYR1 [Penicillium rolfsii]|nr:Peroxiredoxin HYR1 [Penicillium rolfsii]
MRPLNLYRRAPRAFFCPQSLPLRSFNPSRNRQISTTSSYHYHYHHRFTKRILVPPTLSSTSRLSNPRTMSSATSFFEFEPVDKKGAPFPLSSLKGKVVLAINTASKCGFTPQFEGLEKLYKELKAEYPEDVEFLGFPCNQFGGQDPGSNDEIQSFCQLNYGVTFPVLGKVDVNGDQAAPVFSFMKESVPGVLGLKRIKWNFEKFLIAADGKVVDRWSSITKPESLKDAIVKEIEKARKAGIATSTKKVA